MSQLRLSQLDTELRQAGLEAVGFERVKIFNSRGDLVYSDDRKLIGRNDIASDNLREALGGGFVSEIEQGIDDNGRGRQVLEVYTPLSARLRRRRRRRARDLPLLRRRGGRDRPREAHALPVPRHRPRAALRGAVPDRRPRVAAAAPPRPARRPHRPAEPHALPRARRARDQGHAPGAHGRGAARRPRPLQGGQRHARARPRRRAAQGRRRAPQRRAARGRHAGPARRRRVRGRAHRPPAPRRRGRDRRPPPRRAAPAVRPARDRGRARRERRRRALARARARRHDADPARRRRDVRRQAHPGPRRDLLDRARSLLAGPAQPPGRAAARDRGRRARPALPAEGVARGRPRDGRRGARALAAPRARAAAARPVRPARRAHGHDRPPHALGARRRAAPVRRVAARVPGPDRRGQPGGRQRARRRPAGDGDASCSTSTACPAARSSARSPSTP